MKKKHKHSPKKSSTNSIPVSSSVNNTSIEQKHSEQLERVLLTHLEDDNKSTMGDFILKRILSSVSATDITNGQKIKYIKLIEKFLLNFVQKIDDTVIESSQFRTILFNLIFIREHLKIKKDEEDVLKYLLNSEVLSNLFDPNMLDKDNLTLLDLVESLQNILSIQSDIRQNKKLIQWLKEKKGAKNASEILKQDFNKEDYDQNVEKLKKELEGYSITSTQKLGGCLLVSKKEPWSAESLGTSAELLQCFDVILNNKTDEIARHMKLFFRTQNNNESYYIVQVCVVGKLLRECYKNIDIDNYIKIISSIIKDVPLNSLKMAYYEELIERYVTKIGSLTKIDEKLLDDYTRELVKLTVDNNGVTDSSKHHAYRLRLYYCKHKTNLKEIIEVSLELMKYANGSEIEQDFYGLLIALYNIESGSFKNGILAHLVSKFNLSGEAQRIFIDLFSYHNFDRAFVKKIQEELEIIKQAFSTQSQEIYTTIVKFSYAFIMQTGECSVSTIKEIVDDPSFESDTAESTLRILSCLKYWSKNEIEQINYQKVLDKLLNKDCLGRDLITVIKVADLYLTIEDLVQTKHYLDLAENLLKFHKSFQYEIEPKIYLNEVKLGLVLNAFSDNNKEFLKENLSYIKQIYNTCNAIKEKFLSAYQTIIDICHYHLLSKDPATTSTSNSEDEIKNVINKIAEDDEVTFSLEIINQTISEEQQMLIPANSHIDSSNRDLEKYSSEGKSQEDSLYKENFVTKCLNHWAIIHQYYQNLKKSTRFSHDKTSDHPQENHQVWHISNDVSYTTKNENIVNIGKEHHNIYAIIAPDLFNSLEKSEQKAFSTALEKGIVKNYNGVKRVGKSFELKIDGDARLWPSTIYKNDNGAVLIDFNHKTNHAGIRKALKNKINVIKVFGATEHHPQEEDYTLKYNVAQVYDLNIYHEVDCLGEEIITVES
ncbi:hypothetical protein [Candidatus Tisiphia endosymbiont of Temnostethus pusillus]|uniref:hypothetical protein n=1 Tax=Candidatus Tisiphia endosymbiont of Temnostethus pusillus TaxID=3139335 RepID=UPI0035C8A95D